MRIVYLGTPDFAVAPLKKLVEANYNVVGVITSPDKPAGRGRKVQTSPVKDYAISQKLPVLQPTNLKDTDFLFALKQWKADLQIVVAFRMLPESVWNMPSLGTFNLHASLLPNYRGAAPINRVIMNGETITGITTFFLEHNIDTGDIILQKEIDISANDNAGILHDKLMDMGANLVIETLKLIENNKHKTTSQTALISKNKDLMLAPKLFKKDMLINWQNSCDEIDRQIRGLSPYPTAFTTFHNSDSFSATIKIYQAIPRKTKHQYKAGTMLSDGKKTFSIACTNGFIDITELKLQGKKQMPIKAFLAGFKYIDGWCE